MVFLDLNAISITVAERFLLPTELQLLEVFSTNQQRIGVKMEEFMSYDPWQNITTRNGIKGDLIISALQKSIRRGMTEEAISFGFEMYITSSQFEDKLWRRLQAISVEDIGFGDLLSLIHI